MKQFLRPLLLVTVLIPFAGHAQKVNDAQLWENIYMEKTLSKKMVIHLNHEGRITDNISRFNYGYLDLGVTRKMKKYFRLSADYVYVRKKSFDNYIANRHQVYVAGTLRKKIGDLSISDRNMLQMEWQNPFSSVNGKQGELYYRNKVTLRYEGRDVTPYVAAEHYLSLIYSDAYGPQWDRGRYYLGLFYRFSAANAIEGYYMMERHMNVNEPSVNWVIGIGYEHSFYGGFMGKW